MRTNKGLALIFFLFPFLLVPAANAQKRKVPQETVFQALIRIEQKLSPEQKNVLSGSFNNWLAFAHAVLDKPTVGPDDDGKQPPTTFGQTRFGGGATSSAELLRLLDNPQTGTREEERDSDMERISNPRLDFKLSHVGGFTQSTSSSAWCGHNVVTGFRSTLADVITGVLPFDQNPNLLGVSQGSLGVAFSSNDGESFTDLGFLNPGPSDASGSGTVMFGNPVVVCTDPNKFYFLTSPFLTAINNPVTFTAQVSFGVGLSISTDGGRRWADPVSVVKKDENNLLDKAWLAADPHHPKRLYVTYSDLDLDGVFASTFQTARCPNTIRNAIEMVTSADGGRTWSLPVVVREDCQPVDKFGFPLPGIVPTGSQVAVGAKGDVFVSYMLFTPVISSDGFTPIRNDLQVNLRQSTDLGNSFHPEIVVSTVAPTGDPAGASQGALQGLFRNIQVPAMAVGPAARNGKDTLYIAWSDGRDNPQVDIVTVPGIYNFSDILVTKSTDGGSSWSKPRAVSPTPDDFAGVGRDQFQPGIAVNRDGTLAVCYYDRRNDPQNNAVDHYCSISTDHGHSYRDIRQTAVSWAPIHAADILLSGGHLGDYDTVAPHLAAEEDDGFFSSFQIIKNAVPSVYGRSVRRAE